MRRLGLPLLVALAVLSTAVVAQAAHLNVTAAVLQVFNGVELPEVDEADTAEASHAVTVEVRFFDAEDGGELEGELSPVRLDPVPVADGGTYTIDWGSQEGELVECTRDEIAFPGELPAVTGVDGPFEPDADVTHVLCAYSGPEGVNAEVTFTTGGTSTVSVIRFALDDAAEDGTADAEDAEQDGADDSADSDHTGTSDPANGEDGVLEEPDEVTETEGDQASGDEDRGE